MVFDRSKYKKASVESIDGSHYYRRSLLYQFSRKKLSVDTEKEGNIKYRMTKIYAVRGSCRV